MRHGQPSTNRSIPWRAPLLAMVCTAVVLAIGWRLVDQRLAAEAVRQASLGASPAVVALREDWVAALLPTALGESGPVAERARRIASARLDQAVSAATRNDNGDFKRTANAVLIAIRQSEAVPTVEAVRWAEWASQRLTTVADRLAPADRLALLSSVDETLSALAGRARREPPNLPPPLPAVVATPPTEPEPEPVRNAPPAVEWVLPRPIRIAAMPAAIPANEPARLKPDIAPQPRAWNPDWVGAEPESVEVRSLAERGPKSLAEQSDRELLGELVRLASQLPPEAEGPSAAGPTSVPKADDEGPLADLRRELTALRIELTDRGFYAVSNDEVKRLLSDDLEVRVDLVSRLLTGRTGGAPRMLLVLADDASPIVRAAAISALGSSNDQQLTRMAWELALKDRAPEVGRLAESLRVRLR